MMNLDQALQVYIAESRELLEEMETLLLGFAQGAGTVEDVHAVFRAAHTIKGSAGLFGLDGVVAFTHSVESILDDVREGGQPITPDLASLLLECRDHLSELIDTVATGQEGTRESEEVGLALQRRLAAFRGEAGQAVPVPVTETPSGSCALPVADYWHVSLRFGTEVFRNGMDPLSFIRYLGTLGDIVAVTTITDGLPSAEAFDPESCFLGFEIGLRTDRDKAAIEGAFDFVKDDCTVHILPPRSKLSEYVALIKALPEEEARLGEMLVQAGALTARELDDGLRAQYSGENGATSGAERPLGEILVEQRVVRAPVVQAALDKQKAVKDTKSQESRFIRVDADKLDRLISRIGELVIAGAGVGIAARRNGDAPLLELASTVATLVEDVRDGAMQLRMVQIGATFNRFQRVVHDVARDLGKDVALVVTGGETELDKTMVERIGDPLMHLVRNALDHGIERPEVRSAAGKPGQGTLRLNAFHESGSIVIEVADDGGGLHRERILARARERGLVAEDQVLADRDVWHLIFEPGFSTAAEISNLSGRGVGMDVVRRNIAELRGSVEIDTKAGAGTTVRLRLPLTLAIIDGFLVGVGSAVFVVPLDIVEECVELTPQARCDTNGRDFINLRERVLPFIDVRAQFGIEGPRGRRENILVVRNAGERVGLVVDELLGEAQTVIKPLGSLFGSVVGIGGSTILGDGRVALILDVPGLMDYVRAACRPHEASETL